ncbi:MAG: dTDP-4-dehydrorhamnose 3,5-epimerase [Alphaproteobacteria bacterium MarineAlpha5_Bin11]|nr:dTDP-4-dehydrorhamnose 3,5-epimerase [Pelagibacteraceae bacterium]PPR44698.1 MAG: dTDP-4-dehydrorhamnose 3,5-epimerase [Alphaproteobacteria bacterium MarineAlpha5_Bin11]|tara:strand:+ start:3874 stop:4437 length:564 start_codon:yes stop_codon:yes gene_type:complete
MNNLSVIKYFFEKKVIHYQVKRFEDNRGFFSETFNKKTFKELGIKEDFVQDNFSFSLKKNTIRGLHFQKPPMEQSKIVFVVKGSILDVIVDLRKNSKTYGKYIHIVLSDKNFQQVYIPSGFAHGFCTIEDDTSVIYKTSNFYSPENEETILWSDKDLSIDWKIEGKEAILSNKDRSANTFNNFSSPF